MCSFSRRAALSRRARRRRLPAIRRLSKRIWVRARRAEWRGSLMPEPLLTISGLHAGYGETEILRGVGLTVAPGEIVAVLGSNGAGKSTLNRTISGVMRAARGTIRFDEAAIERERPSAIVARGLIHVPEGRRIFPNMT